MIQTKSVWMEKRAFKQNMSTDANSGTRSASLCQHAPCILTTQWKHSGLLCLSYWVRDLEKDQESGWPWSDGAGDFKWRKRK